MRRLGLSLVLILVVPACSSGTIEPGQDLNQTGSIDYIMHSIRHRGTDSSAEQAMLAQPGAPDAIYLNRNGRTYTAGEDDSAAGKSSVVWEQGLNSATIPALNW